MGPILFLFRRRFELLNSDFEEEVENHYQDVTTKTITETDETIPPVTIDELKSQIHLLKTKTAPGIDKISNRVTKIHLQGGGRRLNLKGLGVTQQKHLSHQANILYEGVKKLKRAFQRQMDLWIWVVQIEDQNLQIMH
ncbi:hypothetical protein HUJ05_001507 [Dendroctonus ponderosae]|nr:hypothetical protein HUJ05_001507 [Dendroctonus ponderosae]